MLALNTHTNIQQKLWVLFGLDERHCLCKRPECLTLVYQHFFLFYFCQTELQLSTLLEQKIKRGFHFFDVKLKVIFLGYPQLCYLLWLPFDNSKQNFR